MRHLRHFALLAASVVLIAANGSSVGAGVVSPAGLPQVGNSSFVEPVQQKRKSETITQRIKNAWKDLVGYKFDVACPIPIPLTHATCTETGKNREDARAKCASRNSFCYVTDASNR
jgi:hypothetical protein